MDGRKITSNFGWKFAERICAQLVTFAVSIVLARLLEPSDYGEIALVTVFITLANVFVSDGLGNALIQKREADDIDFSTIFYANIVLSLLCYLLLFLLAPLVADFYDMPELCQIMRVLSIKIPLAAINSIQQAYVSRNLIFKKFFWATSIGTVGSAFVGIGMAYIGFGVWALVWQYLFNSIVDTIALWTIVRWRPKWLFSWERFKSLFSFGWKILVVGLLSTTYNEIRSLIIGKLYSSSDLAYYNKGNQFPHIFITNVNSTIISVLFPVVSQVQDDKERLKKYTQFSIRTSAFIMSPLMVGMACTADTIIGVLLTKKWLEAVPYLRIFCFSYLLLPMQTANIQAIKATGRSDIYLKVEIIKKTIGIVLLTLSLRFGVVAIALSAALSSVCSSVVNAFPNKVLIGYSYYEQILDLLPSVLMSLVMGVIVFAERGLPLPVGVILTIQVISGATIYVMLSALTKNKEYIAIRDLIKHKPYKT